MLLFSSCIVAIPFLIWDILVTNSHWYFNPRYTFLHIAPLPLPVEEILFFITVPFASGVIWEMLFVRKNTFWKSRIYKALSIVYICIPILFVAGVIFLLQGKGYTGMTAIALAMALSCDYLLGTRLIQQPHFFVYLLLYNSLNLLCNGYLTSRPVVTYNPTKQFDIRLFTVPIEDFFYGMALIIAVLSLYSFVLGRRQHENIIEFLIRKKLHNYRQVFHNAQTSAQQSHITHKRVAVIGAGIAGMSAAILLARKGAAVDVYEAESFVGGKCGVWKKHIPHEQQNHTMELEIEHGFHGVFNNYYNFINFLESLHIYDATNFPYIENYCIITRSKKDVIYITDTETTPLLNMWNLLIKNLKIHITLVQMIKLSTLFVFLTYNAKRIYKKYDKISYRDFLEKINMPPLLAQIFTLFSRAFFATNEYLSMAELIRSFHFYYCSHNKGLMYRYFKGSYRDLLITPLVDCFQSLKGKLFLNTPINNVEVQGDVSQNTHTFLVNNKVYDDIIISTDVEATKQIIQSSPQLQKYIPTYSQNMEHMHAGQQYATLTLWIEGHITCDIYPPFFNTEKITLLDAVTTKERIDDTWKQWVKDTTVEGKGHVLELHCYSVEDKYSSYTDEEIIGLFLSDLEYYFPEYKNCTLHYKYLMRNNNFTALHTNMQEHRPETKTDLTGLYLAGDWVKIPFTAFLLEAAHASARLAVNEICERHDAPTETIWMVPQKGVLSI